MKRILGYFSWQSKRKALHSSEALDALQHDLITQNVDHICITGDLTNGGMKQEYSQTAKWVKSLGMKEKISIVPGNHDVYGQDSYSYMKEYWGEWTEDCVFPYLKVVQNVAIIGLSSAILTKPFQAIGEISEDQLRRLDEILQITKEQGLFQLLLLHHPPYDNIAPDHKRLLNFSSLQDILKNHCCDCVLYGHMHQKLEHSLQTNSRHQTTLLGTGSVSYGRSHPHQGHYRILDISEHGIFDVEDRFYNPETQKFDKSTLKEDKGV